MRDFLRKSDANPILLWVVLSLLTVGMTSLVENCSHYRKTQVAIVVTGRVYIMGNEPFTEVAIETEGGKVYVLHGEKAKQIRGLQGMHIEIKGTLFQAQPEAKGVLDTVVVDSYKQIDPSSLKN